jgi:hypothetical protein
MWLGTVLSNYAFSQISASPSSAKEQGSTVPQPSPPENLQGYDESWQPEVDRKVTRNLLVPKCSTSAHIK